MKMKLPKQTQLRMLCSELLCLHVESAPGVRQKIRANLEEIWTSGAILQTDSPIPPLSRVWFSRHGNRFLGRAGSISFLPGLGHFIEMQFEAGSRWFEQSYRPKHMLNPHALSKEQRAGVVPQTKSGPDLMMTPPPLAGVVPIELVPKRASV